MEQIKRSNRRMLAFFLAVLLCVSALTSGALAANATATEMVLLRTEGTVTVKNASGLAETASKGLHLHSGWTVVTAAKSYAWIALDNTKALKLNTSTSVELRSSGDKLEVLVNTGRVFFDVSEKLEGFQTMNIRNGNGVCGIRGTIGEVGEDDVTIYEGSGDYTYTDPATGRSANETVNPGETATGVIDGRKVTIFKQKAEAGTMSGFVSVEFANNRTLAERVKGATDGALDFTNLSPEEALDKQKADEQQALAAENAGKAGIRALDGIDGKKPVLSVGGENGEILVPVQKIGPASDLQIEESLNVTPQAETPQFLTAAGSFTVRVPNAGR